MPPGGDPFDNPVSQALTHIRKLIPRKYPRADLTDRMGPVRENGRFLGWTFCTSTYPEGQFAWVSLGGEFSPRTWNLRHTARREMKNHFRSTRKTPEI